MNAFDPSWQNFVPVYQLRFSYNLFFFFFVFFWRKGGGGGGGSANVNFKLMLYLDVTHFSWYSGASGIHNDPHFSIVMQKVRSIFFKHIFITTLFGRLQCNLIEVQYKDRELHLFVQN